MSTDTERAQPPEQQERPSKRTLLEGLRERFEKRGRVKAPGGPSELIGYLGIRKAIGYVGLALPVILVLGDWVFDGDQGLFSGPFIRSSISAYYYSGFRGVFVGCLFIIGVFLLCYKYRKLDDCMGNIACVSAIGLAMFPTAPDNVAPTWLAGHLHHIFASIFLVTVTLICLFIFTLSNPDPKTVDNRTQRKKTRNIVYYSCGGIMAIALAIAVINGLFQFGPPDTLFLCETAAVWAFGFAWIVKGEVLLKDIETHEQEAATADPPA